MGEKHLKMPVSEKGTDSIQKSRAGQKAHIKERKGLPKDGTGNPKSLKHENIDREEIFPRTTLTAKEEKKNNNVEGGTTGGKEEGEKKNSVRSSKFRSAPHLWQWTQKNFLYGGIRKKVSSKSKRSSCKKKRKSQRRLMKTVGIIQIREKGTKKKGFTLKVKIVG